MTLYATKQTIERYKMKMTEELSPEMSALARACVHEVIMRRQSMSRDSLSSLATMTTGSSFALEQEKDSAKSCPGAMLRMIVRLPAKSVRIR